MNSRPTPGLNRNDQQDEVASHSTTSTFKVPVTIKSTPDTNSANVRQSYTLDIKNNNNNKTSETSTITDVIDSVKLSNTVASAEPTKINIAGPTISSSSTTLKSNPIMKQVSIVGQVTPIASQVSQSSTPPAASQVSHASTPPAASHSSSASAVPADPIQISLASSTVRKKTSQDEKGASTNTATPGRTSTSSPNSKSGIILVPQASSEKK